MLPNEQITTVITINTGIRKPSKISDAAFAFGLGHQLYCRAYNVAKPIGSLFQRKFAELMLQDKVATMLQLKRTFIKKMTDDSKAAPLGYPTYCCTWRRGAEGITGLSVTLMLALTSS